MGCNNCYNGCTEIVSDKCVKYTGPDIPELGISTGDTLAAVEAAVTSYLMSALTGEGIMPIIEPNIICDTVKDFLPCADCNDFNLNELLSAIIQAICSLNDQIVQINEQINNIEGDYDVDCLEVEGVEPDSGTHLIVQAIINRVCALTDDLAALIIDLQTNYVSIADIDTYIQSYISSQPSTDNAASRMVPYTIVAYYGPLTNYPAPGDGFDVTGAGIGYWTDVYLVNGNNAGIPDLRGAVPVGATTMGGNPFPPATNPAISGNPTYTVPSTVSGTNQVTLTISQFPNHDHPGSSASITPSDHKHSYIITNNPNGPSGGIDIGYDAVGDDKHIGGNLADTTTVHLDAGVTIAAQGGGLPHNNIQPVLPVYYIMYKP